MSPRKSVPSSSKMTPIVKKALKKAPSTATKFNMRKYKICARFSSIPEFEHWVAEEAGAPWYLCSTYSSKGITKRVYACRFRKRIGFAKCVRQLKAEIHGDNSVIVLDSSDNDEHIHEPEENYDGSRKHRKSSAKKHCSPALKRNARSSRSKEEDSDFVASIAARPGETSNRILRRRDRSRWSGDSDHIDPEVLERLHVELDEDVDDSALQAALAESDDDFDEYMERGGLKEDAENDGNNEDGIEAEEILNQGVNDLKYNLDLFAKELAYKLTSLPLEKSVSVREMIRREMELVYARQIVNEICTGFDNEADQHEVVDRIRGILREF